MSVTFAPYNDVVPIDVPEDEDFNLCNSNAGALLGALQQDTQDLWGECELPRMLALVSQARTADLSAHTRETVRVANFISYGLHRQELLDRLDRFEACLRKWEEEGANKVCWG